MQELNKTNINILDQLKNDVKNFNLLESPILLAILTIILGIIPMFERLYLIITPFLSALIVLLIGIICAIKYEKALSIGYKLKYSATILLFPLLIFNGYMYLSNILNPVKSFENMILLGNFFLIILLFIGAIGAYISLFLSNRITLFIINSNTRAK